MTLILRLLYVALAAAIIGWASVKMLYPPLPIIGEYKFTGELNGFRSLKVVSTENIGMIYIDNTGKRFTYLGSLKISGDKLSIVWIKEKIDGQWIDLQKKFSDQYQLKEGVLVAKNGDKYKKIEPSIWQKIFSL
jgi:hypothetical protein